MQFMQMCPNFALSAERFSKYSNSLTNFNTDFTGQAQNHLVFKGPIVSHQVRLQFPFKIIIPANFPMAAPMVYLDQQAPPDVIARIDYLTNQQNMV